MIDSASTAIGIPGLTHVEHIGIAVADLEEAVLLWTQLLGVAPYKREEVASEHVTTVFFQCGQTKIELLQATSPESAISKYLERNRPGIHHVAFAVDDIRAEMKRLAEAGYRVLQEEPKAGADDKWICFLHPKSTTGVLVELCQDRGGIEE